MKITTIRMFLVAAIGIVMTTGSWAQTWDIGYQTMTFVDSSRSNRQIETELFYPTDLSGTGVPLGSPIDKKYPIIIFGHDQNTGWNNYAYIWNKYAVQGFIVAVPKTEMGVAMDVIEYAKDMAFIASQFNIMRYQPGNFFFKRMNGKSCFMGHGTGGSAGAFAVQYYPAVTTMVALEPIETVPSAINAATLVTVPSVIVAGEDDCVAPAATNATPMFDNLDTYCKTFVSFLNADHCNFAQNSGSCASAQVLCPNPSQSWQNISNNANYLIISFLRYYLKSNAPALDKFEWKLINKANVWTYIYACSTSMPRLSTSEDQPENTTRMSFYPNPLLPGTVLNMEINSEESLKATVMVSNLMGQVVSTEEISLEADRNELHISTGHFTKGHYIVSVISAEGRKSMPLIVQ